MDSRVLVFWEDGFPFTDTAPIELKKIIDALPPMQSVRSAGVEDTRRYLKRESIDLLINPYGSAFPHEVWPQIRDFLISGGNLLNIGGSPFSMPVHRGEDGWQLDKRTDVYGREIGIEASTPLSTELVKVYDTTPEEPLLSGLINDFGCERVYDLQIRLNETNCRRDNHDLLGVREASIRPLCYGLGPGWKRIMAPVIAVDHLFGPCAGGRWVLLNYRSDEYLRRETLFRLSGYAALGPCDLQVRPSFPCYYPEERANLEVHVNWFGYQPPDGAKLNLDVSIRRGKTLITSLDLDIEHFRSPHYQLIPLNFPLTPGLYTVETHLSTGDPTLSEKSGTHSVTGFWCYDLAAVSQTQPLGLGRDYFMRRDKPSPLLGVAYPALGSHMDILSDPNPALWDSDFQEMAVLGVNAVRTCIRGGHRAVMPAPGAPNEGMLRALTAYMLTAAQHCLPVILALFADLPATWGGANPYLDPKSLLAQKEFISAVSRRLAGFNNLMWDLIDDPGFAGPSAGLCRPNRDRFDEASWQRWVRSRYRSDRTLRAAWHSSEPISTDLPSEEDFGGGDDSLPMRAVDYKLLSQESFIDWSHMARTTIRQNGNNKQLITVGLETRLGGEAPDPALCLRGADFSSMHGSASLTYRMLGKPIVICESAVAHDDTWVGSASEDDQCRALERKLISGYGCGATGVIEWASVANADMSQVGALAGFRRPDGTVRPVAELYPKVSAFLKEARPYFLDRQIEDVCIVTPQSLALSDPAQAESVVRRCASAFQDGLRTPVRFIGEYACDSLGKAKLAVLPSARVINRKSWDVLIKAVEAGLTLLVTGPIDQDEHRLRLERFRGIGIEIGHAPLGGLEQGIVFGSEHLLCFPERIAGSMEKAVIGGQSAILKLERIGSGKLIVVPLPFELAENTEPMLDLYRYALRQADVVPPFSVSGADAGLSIRFQSFRQALCYSIISESDRDTEIDLTDGLTARTLHIRVPAHRAAMFLLARTDASVLAEYGGAVTRGEP